MISVIRKFITLPVLALGMAVLLVQPPLAFGLPYGEGNYGGCEYSENCATNSGQNGSGTNGSSGTSSGEDTSISSDDQSSQTSKTPNTGTEPVTSTAEAEELSSGAHWWQYLSLILLIIFVFWWFIAAWKRRKKDNEPENSESA